MQCNFVVDGNGAGAIQIMDKNAAIIGNFTLHIYTCVIRITRATIRCGEISNTKRV